MSESDPARAAAHLVDLFIRAANRYGPHAVQIITPLWKGELGVINLNTLVRAAVNPPQDGAPELGGYRVGDRVIQTLNDYTLGIMNGDTGTVSAIDVAGGTLTVDFDERRVDLTKTQLQGLEFAWAITVHKSQGSQYPCVLLPICTQHYAMLSRQTCYTGLTRAQQSAVFVGQKKALAMAVRQTKSVDRRTRLASLLRALA